MPHGAAQLLEKKNFENVEEMNIDDTLTLGPVTIRATNAIHAHERHKFGPTAECLGYLIDGTHNVYFAGDTDLFPEMADLVEHLDVALLPIWGWGPSLLGVQLLWWRAPALAWEGRVQPPRVRERRVLPLAH